MKEIFLAKGRVELFVARGMPRIIRGEVLYPRLHGQSPVYDKAELDFSGAKLLFVDDDHNIVLNQGRDIILKSMTTGFALTAARMSIGDRGTIPSDSTVPKTPTPDRTALFNEIFRSDIDTTTLTIAVPDPKITFIKTFSAADVPITSFSNQANPVVNEVGLIMADLFIGAPLPRVDVAAPDSPPNDEKVFAMRTFKSIPFEAANEITITIRYTFFIE